MGNYAKVGKPMDEQAQAVLKSHLTLTSRHDAKSEQGVNGSQSTGEIHSLATFDKYVSALANAGEWAKTQGPLVYIKDISATIAQAYLEHRADQGIGQKQLDSDRNALAFVVSDPLARATAQQAPPLTSRAYTPDQVQQVAEHQNERNAFATQLAFNAGLRAHELLTLRPSQDIQASTHRNWRDERFRGRESGQRYVVTGKGGLRREVIIAQPLADRLEALRWQEPKTVTDRGIHYQQHYNIAGGNAWSKSFSDASTRALSWSAGAHGLRHSYAQQRVQTLQNKGFTYKDAREITSQELGHFRGDIVETYLR